MTKPLSKTFLDRLDRVGTGRRVPLAELEDLATYWGEIEHQANELETKFGDFQANVDMYLAGGQDRDERRDLREEITTTAEQAAAALRILASLAESLPVGLRSAG